MKTTKTFLSVLFVLLLFSASQCEKEDLHTLPPETQEGKNTFGCYINGELFVKGKAPGMPGMAQRISATYSHLSKELCIHSYLNPEGSMHIVVKNPDSNKEIVPELCYYYPYDYSQSCACFVSRQNGVVYLAKYDPVNLIVSGRFSFDGQCSNEFMNPIGDSMVHITEGRFDITLEILD